MGLLAIRKHVILPIYKPADHTPAFYKDPHSGRLIPTAYFLKNLDTIGPQHWQNFYTADFRLQVVSTMSENKQESVVPTGCYCCSDSEEEYENDADMQSEPHECVPHSPQSSQPQYIVKPAPCYYVHTLVLATQSGFFNQCLGPINCVRLPETVTLPIPYPEALEPILHWLYHHDDDVWLDVITMDNLEKFYENVRYLKLGREAYDVLDTFIEEQLEMGMDVDIEGVVEVY